MGTVVSTVPTQILLISLLATLAVLLILVYYSTGGPGARYELYRQATDAIHRLNDGPITLRQSAWGSVTSVLRSALTLSPWKVDDAVTWARSAEKAFNQADGPESRQVVYSLLAAASEAGTEAHERLWRREASLTADTVDRHAIEAARSLEEVRDVVKASERQRLRMLLWPPFAAVDAKLLAPLVKQGLDAIGRGTSGGLLLGVLLAGDRTLSHVVATVGTASLVGGACGSVYFLGSLIRLLPGPEAQDHPIGGPLGHFLSKHPFVVAACFPLGVTLLIWISTWLAHGLNSVLP